jgi:orotidine-5'-phosphate decarboxylase
VSTSNPSATEIQGLVADGRPIYRHVADLVARWGEGLIGRLGYSSLGAVAGGTRPEVLAELRQAYPATPLLVPGFGAQGAGPLDVARAFDGRGLGALVAASRSVIASFGDPEAAGPDWPRAVAEAAKFAKERIMKAVEEAAG